MASGDVLAVLLPTAYEPPSTNYARWSLRNGHPVLLFDPTTNQSAIWTGVLLRNYAGTTGVTVVVHWAAGATGANVKWDGFFEATPDDTFDIDADGFTASPQTVTDAAASVVGEVAYSTITFTDGAQIDSLAIGEVFRFKLERDAADAADTLNSNDAEVVSVEIRET